MSPRLKEQRRRIAAALVDVASLCEDAIQTGEAISEHVEYSVEGMLTAGACERIRDDCLELRLLVAEEE